jgi:IS1 family transposase
VLGVAKDTILRIIEETGTALADYMHREFRDLPCARIEMDEQWQYVAKHGQRMNKREPNRGDFWLWCAVDSDTKLVINYYVGRRDWRAAEDFVQGTAKRTKGNAQVATDGLASYIPAIRAYFGDVDYGTEIKTFGEPNTLNASDWHLKRKNGVEKIVSAKREVVFGSPDLGSLTTSHIERVFLSVRQECTRFTRMTLGYSKTLVMHKAAVNLYFGVYNLVRRHTGIDRQTPAMAAGIEDHRWTLEEVVSMADDYWAPKYAAQAALKAQAKREKEDAEFLQALATMEEGGMPM